MHTKKSFIMNERVISCPNPIQRMILTRQISEKDVGYARETAI